MKDKSYHHGDLKNKLIEAGIEIVSEEGVKDFSLRKVAAKCGVSHAAPYAHFSNVEALNKAMGEYIERKFVDRLKASVHDAQDSRIAVFQLGKAYISFFEEHPPYFQFLFYYSGTSINLDAPAHNSYQPFEVFRETAYRMFADMKLAEDQYEVNLLAHWSLVHGIASLLTNPNIHYDKDWGSVLSDNLFFGRNQS